jgi:phosphate starvation-inducible PhoH-like protein
MTQIDLPYSQKSGLIDALEVLRHVKEIATVEFNIKDIVRHPLVRLIVDAYEKRVEGFKQSKSTEVKQKTE